MLMEFRNASQKLRFSVQEYSGNNMASSHMHDTYELYVLMEGERNLFIKDSFFEVAEGNVFLIKPFVEHRTLNSGKTRYVRMACYFTDELLKQIVGDARINTVLENDVVITLPAPQDFQKILMEIKSAQEALQERTVGYELATTAAMLKILSIFFQCENITSQKALNASNYERISGLVKYINQNFALDMSVSALAQQFFISEFYMCRLFKEYTGKTIAGYVTSVRILKAKQLLSETNLKVSVIYKQCGFGSLSNFNRCFKEQCGETPVQYRKRR